MVAGRMAKSGCYRMAMAVAMMLDYQKLGVVAGLMPVGQMTEAVQKDWLAETLPPVVVADYSRTPAAQSLECHMETGLEWQPVLVDQRQTEAHHMVTAKQCLAAAVGLVGQKQS